MTHRFLAAGALTILTAASLAAQAPSSKASPSSAPKDAAPATTAAKTKTPAAPRTSDGHPDLDGIWSYVTATPLEKPGGSGAYIYAREDSANPVGGYNNLFFDTVKRGPKDRPTSQIVDPPDGHLPPLTPAAQKRQALYAEKMMRPATGPEDRALYERCIVGFNSGPPIIPGGYNQNLQVVQTPGTVALYTEMIHTTRVVPMDGRAHGTLRQWNGEPRGHWEGDTLVVDSVNFTDQGTGTLLLPVPLDENLHLVERFSLLDNDTLLYQYTVDDPTIFTKPWSGQLYMTRSEDQIYEYACHEGNYAMPAILGGARREEKADASKQSSKP
jgi:hypothetical protein